MILATIVSGQIFIRFLHAVSQLSPYFVFFDVIYHFRFKNDDDFIGLYCDILRIPNCNKDKVCQAIGRSCGKISLKFVTNIFVLFNSNIFPDYSYLEQVVLDKILIFLLTGVFYFVLLLGKEYKAFGKKSKKSERFIFVASSFTVFD